MPSHLARIERRNGRVLDNVQVLLTVSELRPGRPAWSGEFLSRSADGFQPSERFGLTLDNGQRGTASVSRTHLDSRTPEQTRIEFIGSGPLI
jgi:hypothetical protein